MWFPFRRPSGSRRGPSRSSTLCLVLRDRPASVQFFHDQINAVILYQRTVRDEFCRSPAFRPLSCLKSHPPAGSSATIRSACQSLRSRFHCRCMDPVQIVVALPYRRQLFPFVPCRALRYQLWISSLRIMHKNNSIVCCSQFTNTHTNQKIITVAKVRTIHFQKWRYRDTAPTNTPTQTGKLSRMQMVQRCTITTKVSYVPTRMPVPEQL